MERGSTIVFPKKILLAASSVRKFDNSIILIPYFNKLGIVIHSIRTELDPELTPILNSCSSSKSASYALFFDSSSFLIVALENQICIIRGRASFKRSTIASCAPAGPSLAWIYCKVQCRYPAEVGSVSVKPKNTCEDIQVWSSSSVAK
jgi:hypothetical protein